MEQSKVSDQIVRFALDTKTSELPETALQVFKLSLVDWISVAVAGTHEPVAGITRALVEREGGTEEAYALGLKQRVPARAAALLNGASSHALDYDDTHFASLGHPSVAVLPAVLAAADVTGARPDEIKAAALIGMEIAVRTGVWLGRDHYRAGFHITGTAGTFGATMAVARLMQLSPPQAHYALGIATSRASGVKAQFGSMGKPMHAGFAASNAVESAMLAELGFTAGAYALESSQGFAATHHGEFNQTAFDNTGHQYLFESVSHKFHACCHGTHAAAEALLAIREQVRPAADSVKSIDITVHPQYLDICNIQSPSTGLQAKFSYHMVAALVMNHHDTARMDTFADTICDNEQLRKISNVVYVHTDPKLSETSAQVKLSLSTGDTFNKTHDLLQPMDYAERRSRILSKCGSILGIGAAKDVWQNVAEGSTLPTRWMSEYINTAITVQNAVAP